MATASNGQPVPDKYVLPHVKQFVAEFQTPAKTYRFTFDEARKRSLQNTLSMRRDGFIISRLQARYLPVLGAEWHVTSQEEAEEQQAKDYSELIRKIPRFLQLRKCLLEAVWFGRYGVQLQYGPVDCCGRQMIGVTGWIPVNGDKITWTYDGHPAVRVHPTYAATLKSEGANVEAGDKHTSIGDLGYVLILDKPAYRQKFIFHQHEVEDADYNEPELAGGVNGVGLRHYCYWIWWLRQEIMDWLLAYLEMMGAGGLTVVGYDMSNPNGLDEAKAAFAERATVVYLPIPPGQDKQSNIVQRIEPSGTGNDIFHGWIEGYFNAVMTQIIIGQDLSTQSKSTGLGSGVADFQADVKAQIHAYDAQNLDETLTQQLLNVLVQLNEPRATYSLQYETILQKRDPEKALQAAQTAYQMGADVPESHVLKMANIPEPKEGEKILSMTQQQEASAQAGAFGSDVQGRSLDEMRQQLNDAGMPEDEHLHHLADMVDSGELREIDAEGGVRYDDGSGQRGSVGTTGMRGSQPATYAKEDWIQEVGPRGGEHWRNTKTGTVQYREPGDRKPAKDEIRSPQEEAQLRKEDNKGNRSVATPQKGLATQGAYDSIDRALRGESPKTLEGDGVLRHVMDTDKRLLKAQVVSLAAKHGMLINSNTTKTRALAYIEDKLRKHQHGGKTDGTGSELRGQSEQGVSAADPGHGKTAGVAGGDQQPSTPPDRDSGNQEGTAGSPETAQNVDGAGDSVTKDVFSAGLEKSDLTSKMRQSYGQTAKDVHSRLPQAAKERFEKNVKGCVFHEDTKTLTEKLIERDPGMKKKLGRGKAGGAYSKKTGELHLNGGTTLDGKKLTQDHVYAHEFAHAIDGPEHELSKSADWKAAWKEEGANVSKYATRTPQEGFAEFGRLVYAGELGSDQLQERYPKMYAHWEAQGLLPDGMKQSGGKLVEEGKPQLSDIFEEPIETPEHIGDKALQRRGTSEPLKDYLHGIGAAGAHEGIASWAQQLHKQASDQVDTHNEIVRSAMSALSEHYGKSFTKAHPDLKKDDPAEINGLDTVASELAGRYKEVLGGDAGYEGDRNDTRASDKSMKILHGMLKEGIKEYPDLREYEDQAVNEWHEKGRPIPQQQAESDIPEGEAAEPENADTSFDFGGEADDLRGSSEEAGSTDGRGSGDPAGTAGEEVRAGQEDFMQPEETGPHSEDDVPGYAGQSFTNDRGATVTVRKDEDGTWSVGSKSGLTQAGVAKHLNSIKAEKAQGLFGDDVTAQQIAQKEKEKLEWNKPTTTTPEAELPGMKDTFAPGMFGQAANENAEKSQADGKTHLETFTSSMSPMQKARAEKHLSKKLRSEGEEKTLANIIEEQVKGGAAIKSNEYTEKISSGRMSELQGELEKMRREATNTPAEKRSEIIKKMDEVARTINFGYEKVKKDELVSPDGSIRGEAHIGKHGVDYAKHLLQSQGSENATPKETSLEGWHADQFQSISQAMTKQMDNVTAPRRKLDVAMRLIHGEPPAVQQALLDHLQKEAPEAYQYGQFNPESIGLSVRDIFKKHADKQGKMVEGDKKSDKAKKPETAKPKASDASRLDKAQATLRRELQSTKSKSKPVDDEREKRIKEYRQLASKKKPLFEGKKR